MKVSISQQVKFRGVNRPYYWTKEYESTIIPHAGDQIEDPIWKNPYEYKVTEVTIDYYENTCFVSVETYAGEFPEDRKDELAEMSKLHGWKASWTMYKK